MTILVNEHKIGNISANTTLVYLKFCMCHQITLRIHVEYFYNFFYFTYNNKIFFSGCTICHWLVFFQSCKIWNYERPKTGLGSRSLPVLLICSLDRSWSSPVSVFFQSRDWTSKHYTGGLELCCSSWFADNVLIFQCHNFLSQHTDPQNSAIS